MEAVVGSDHCWRLNAATPIADCGLLIHAFSSRAASNADVTPLSRLERSAEETTIGRSQLVLSGGGPLPESSMWRLLLRQKWERRGRCGGIV